MNECWKKPGPAQWRQIGEGEAEFPPTRTQNRETALSAESLAAVAKLEQCLSKLRLPIIGLSPQ
jgi:hypothetical protein